MADDGADVESILQLAEDLRSPVDYGNLVGLLAREMIGRRRANLASAENENFHRAWCPVLSVCIISE
jgi:hypothetical protein